MHLNSLAASLHIKRFILRVSVHSLIKYDFELQLQYTFICFISYFIIHIKMCHFTMYVDFMFTLLFKSYCGWFIPQSYLLADVGQSKAVVCCLGFLLLSSASVFSCPFDLFLQHLKGFLFGTQYVLFACDLNLQHLEFLFW